MINEKLLSKVLWTNPNPKVAFPAQSIVLNDKIENYRYYEIIYIAYANDNSAWFSIDTFLSTGKFAGRRTRLPYLDYMIRNRTVTNMSENSMTFGNGGSYATYASDTLSVNNLICVPYQVIGYK